MVRPVIESGNKVNNREACQCTACHHLLQALCDTWDVLLGHLQSLQKVLMKSSMGCLTIQRRLVCDERQFRIQLTWKIDKSDKGRSSMWE